MASSTWRLDLSQFNTWNFGLGWIGDFSILGSYMELKTKYISNPIQPIVYTHLISHLDNYKFQVCN